MKKFVSFLSVAAVLSMSAFSCQKPVEEVLPQTDPDASHTVNFIVGDVSTKTAVVVDAGNQNVTSSWLNTNDSYVHFFENGVEGTGSKINISEDNSKATFTSTFSGVIVVGNFSYRAIVAGKYSGGIATIPAVQYPAADSYDPSADVLLGKADYNYRPHHIFELKTAAEIEMKFARANAINRIEIKGLKAGEKIEYIEVKGENNIAGPLNALKDFEFAGYNEAEGSKSISLVYSDNNTVSSEGTFVTYFTSWAVKPGSFGITVVTDKSTYGKTAPAESGAKFEYKIDKVNNIKADLTGQELASSRFDLVKGTPSEWDGTYIFASSDKAGKVKILDAESSANGYAADAVVTDVNGHLFIACDDKMSSLAWDLSNTGKKLDGEPMWNVQTGTAWFIFNFSKYLFNYNNKITVSEFNFTGLILTRKYFYHLFKSFDDGVQMTCHHDGTKTYMGWNGSSFGYTGDPSNRVFLYKYNDTQRQSQIISYDEEILNWPVASGKYEIGKTYDGQPFSESSKYQKELISYTSSDTNVATVDSEGKVTIKKEGEVTITAVAAANTSYRGASASYSIRIFSPHYFRVTDVSQITSGDRYLIVSKTELLTSWYHAFCATNTSSYDYDINTISNVFDGIIYDSGNKIKPSTALDANQVIIEKGILSGGRFTVKPVSVGKYLYCDTELSSYVSNDIKFPTYSIAFADSEGANWLQRLEQLATSQHNITIDEDAIVTISSALNEYGLGGHLYYSKIDGKFSYVNLTVLDQFDDVVELIAYLEKDSQYADILKFIASFSKDVSIKDIIAYFSADLYLYKYFG